MGVVMIYGGGEYRYELVENWAQLPGGRSFLDIGGIGIDREDRVYIFNRSQHPLMIFERNGEFAGGWGEDYFVRPHGMCITPADELYCTDDMTHLVSKFTLDGDLLMTLGEKDTPSDTGYVADPDLMTSLRSIQRGGPPFNRPTGVARSSSGEIFVADGYGNARVHRFTSDGRLLFSWGEPGTGEGEFMLPHNIRIDKLDRIWIPDRENSRIQIFDPEGGFVTAWYDVSRPSDVFFDEDDVVYVSEIGHEEGTGPRISLFTLEGEVITRWGNPMLDHETDLFISPHAIAVDPHGDVYVGEVAMTHAGFDRGSRVIQKFARI
jgi:DNA-binding beta-propeller fold protein YncE